VASPFKEAEFEIYFQEGISEAADVIDLAVTNEVIQKSGAWFSFENEKIGQGREATRKYLKDNPKIISKIKKQVIEKLKAKPKV
jgi:recombination protein RecA